MISLEKWCPVTRGWITLATFATRAEARARAWSLKLQHFRVRG